MDHSLLLLDNLLQLLLAELTQKFFVEDRHDSTFLLLSDQLLKQNCLIILRHMRDGVQLALFVPRLLLLCRLFPDWPELLSGCGLGLLSVSLSASGSVRLRSDELLVALGGLARLRSLRSLLLSQARLLAGKRARGRLALRRCLHEPLQWVLLAHALRCVAHPHLLTREALLAARSSILGDLVVDHHGLGHFALASLLLLDVNLLHLVLLAVIHLLLHHLTIRVEHAILADVHLLSVAFVLLLLLLLLHLLLLLQEKHLLDLLLSQLLVDHLLLGREVILFDLLSTALDFELMILTLSIFIFITTLAILVHDFAIFAILVVLLLLHLSCLKH